MHKLSKITQSVGSAPPNRCKGFVFRFVVMSRLPAVAFGMSAVVWTSQ